MPDIVEKLFQTASKARENAYAPYSNFKVGAAILTKDGQVFAGTNIEEAAYKTICAEAAAIANMVTQTGRQVISAVMVVGGSAESEMLVTPCGHCRQYLREHMDGEMKIYVAGPEGVRRIFTLDELLPYSFGPENLK